MTAIVVTHQIRDARYIATHEAARTGERVEIRDADEQKSAHARFMVLHEGRIRFEGTVQELLASTDPFLERFLFMTLPPW